MDPTGFNYLYRGPTRGTAAGSRSCAANISVSRTVESANSASSCSTYADMRAICWYHNDINRRVCVRARELMDGVSVQQT
jgi:hypothetical protein